MRTQMNKNYVKRIRYIQEQTQTLLILIELYQIDRNSVISLIEDAKIQQNLLVPNTDQNSWITKLRQDKLKRLAAKLQANQRFQAANIINKNDVAVARQMLNWPPPDPFRRPVKKPLPIIKV
jgi:replication initiation and membrane attachment protein DnaB